MGHAIGIDLGGTKLYVGLVDDAGKILRHELIKTSKDGPKAVVADIIAAVKKLTQGEKSLEAIGIGMAGQIENSTGTVLFAPNLGWKNFPLGHELRKGLGTPISITNDVRAAAWGEWLHGAGRGCNDLVCLFVGTGIGSGIVTGGRMLIGSNNAAGEVGHMTINLNGSLCSCGNRGCVETLAAGWGIAKRAKEVAAYDPAGSKGLLEMCGGNSDNITAVHVFNAAREKVPAAMKVIEETKEALIAAVAGLANAFNPERIILGGGIIQGNPELVEVIRQGVPKRGLKATTDSLEIVPAELKGDAGVVGAAAFARTQQKVGKS